MNSQHVDDTRSHRSSHVLAAKPRFTVAMHPKTFQVGNRTFTIRNDSPRTQQAIKELGMDMSKFHIKKLEEFGGMDVDEEIKKIRYEHYINRTIQDFSDLLFKRKEIIKQQRARNLLNMQEGTQKTEKSIQKLGKSMSESQIDPQNMMTFYNKTMTYLRQSHDTPKIKEIDEVMSDMSIEGGEFEELMLGEIKKFNTMKSQKQQEAKKQFDDEIKRMKSIQTIRKKETRMLKAIVDQKKKNDLKIKKQSEDWVGKQNQVQQERLNYEKNLNKNREAIEERTKQMELRHSQYLQEKERIRLEREQKYRERFEKISQWKSDGIKGEMMFCMQTMSNLQEKMNECNQRSQMLQQEKIMRLKEKEEQERRYFTIYKEKNQEMQKSQLSTMVEKLVQREESFKENMSKKFKEEIKKQKEQNNKDKDYQRKKGQVEEMLERRQQELMDKFSKNSSNLEHKRQEQEKKNLINQELRRLKELDKHELNERQNRQKEYRLQKIMEKEQIHAEMMDLRRQQQEILRKTKEEVSQQCRIESERIHNSIMNVSNSLFPKTHNDSLEILLSPENKLKSLKILKTVFPEKDLEEINNSLVEPKRPEELLPKDGVKQK